jgi:polyisoprenyl-teichoic acid--peptidoglycan teichoic acid transferase
MSRRRSLVLTLVGPPLCGVLVAGLVTAAWLAVGRPAPAKGATWLTVQQVGSGASFSGSPTDPRFFLVVGSDARSGGPGAGRGDAVHVVGVNPAAGAATIIGIPRDTAVPIPGHGTEKVNAALALGGLELQAQTLSQLVGIDLPIAVATDFGGFIQMIDEMGGIEINIPVALDDPDSGAVFAPGPQHIDGTQALAFSRDRKDFPSGDVARSENHGLLIIAALGTLRNTVDQQNNSRSAQTLRLLAILGRHTELRGVNLVDLYRIGRLGFSIDPAKVRNVVIPTGGGSGSNLSVGPDAQSLFQDFADDALLQSH